MNLTLKQIFFMSPLLVLGFSIILNLLIIIIKRNFFLSFLVTILGLSGSLYSFHYFVYKNIINNIYFLVFYNIDEFYVYLFIFSSLFTVFFSYLWLRDVEFNREEFYLLLLISTMGGYLLFLFNDIFTIFIGIELLSFPLFGMMGYFSFKKNKNLESSFKYFIISSISSIFLLLGLSLIYLSSGNLNLFFLNSMSSLLSTYKFYIIFLFGVTFLYISLFIKFSIFPFYIWISDIYSGTSFIILMYFSNAIKTIIFYILLKFFIIFSFVYFLFSSFLLKLFVIFSILFASILSLFQKDFKRFIGYSSVVHSGYLMIPMIFLNCNNYSQVIKISFLAYFINSVVLFGSMYLISFLLDKKECYLLKNYEGIFWKSPILSITIIISFFSMIGIPLTIGFLGKFYLLKFLVEKQEILLILTIFFGSIISLYYYFNFIKIFFYKKKNNSFHNFFIPTKLYIFFKIFTFLLSLVIIFIGCNPQFLKSYIF